MRTLFGPTFTPLAQRARELGLCFAAALLVHLRLVAWMSIVSGTDLALQFVIFFGVSIFWTYLLAALSFESVSNAVGAKTARRLRMIGVEYLSVVFFVDFNKDRIEEGQAGGKFLAFRIFEAPTAYPTGSTTRSRPIARRRIWLTS